MNLVLIGYRGSGKSAVAAELSRISGRPSVSTDAEAERRAGCPIADYVARHGWPAFRALEKDVVAEAAAAPAMIVDTGGGVVTDPANTAALKRNGFVVWLRTTPETVRQRIENETGRPSLSGNRSFIDEIEAILEERTPLYADAADAIVDTDGQPPDAIASRIWALFQSRETAT